MTLLLFAILLLLHIAFVCASLSSLNGTGIPTVDVSDYPSCSNTRTLWDIIWSCAATLFACTWTSIHPNIPGMDEGKWTVLFRRLFFMAMALTAPELMITWATNQFLSARVTANAFNDVFGARLHQIRGDHSDIRESITTLLNGIPTSDGRNSSLPSAPHAVGRDFRGWTVTHGFFAWMGGFMLYFNDKPRATLIPDELERFVREGSVDMPVIIEADIEDRSKGDGLSKSIAVLQLAWFVLQLVARHAQNLPITLLEIDTLAVAVLTCVAYAVWWKKPKDVGRPYAIHWQAIASPPSRLAYDKVNADFSLEGWRRYAFFLVYPWGSLMGTGVFISPRAVRERRVPSLGGYDDHDRHDRNHIITLLIGCFSGMVFGGIHCLGWNVLFQGHTEQILWRAASLMVASAPVFILLIFGCAILLEVTEGHWGENVARFAAVIMVAIYVAARITFIVLLLLSFRSLPPGVYDTVAWTKFIPHL
ncbi:hypothetical protein DEU56DRAFT_954638 [Suillus clintonianus]|uniref:uncharacterized protein n=1 Tax=Suillus clintonianus TaxID=1904413 RepID=UPI001B882EE9|nr:uncharacterized protein DEU56DRAFT_954638 [Suillus clintonianus]KAG2130720.1 hypothetical protein DEU56DRAFT_954638 [Suillus clintonianus]